MAFKIKAFDNKNRAAFGTRFLIIVGIFRIEALITKMRGRVIFGLSVLL